MHVLIIPTEAYIPPEAPLDGIFQHHQAQALKKAGITVGIISPVVNSFLSFILGKSKFRFGISKSLDIEIPVIRTDAWAYSLKNITNVRNKWIAAGIGLFKNYIRHYGKPDIVHAHNTWYAGVLANEIKNKFGIKYIITEHSSAYSQNLIPENANSYILNAILNASNLVVVSPVLGEILTTKFPKAKNWIFIPNILDELFEAVDINLTIESNLKSFVFLNIANLNENKNQELLIRAFSNKFRNLTHIKLKIGGEGHLLEKLKSLAQQLDIEQQVLFLGNLSRNEVLNEMQKCNAFVLSSITETFGVVLIEAMACGKPLISTKSGGPESIITDENGILVENKNETELANAMYLMYQDYSKFNSSHIRRYCIDKFGQKAISGKLLNIYQKVIST